MKKSIGLELNAPREKCSDRNCAWHGKISIRGRVFQGVVRSAKSRNTAIVEWGFHRYVPKYERYERSKTRVTAHNPDCIKAKEGDVVVIGECRPLSKTKHFVVLGRMGEGMFEIEGEDLLKKEKPGDAENAGLSTQEKKPRAKRKATPDGPGDG